MVIPPQPGFRQPAEWAEHEATFLAWPSAEDLWRDNLDAARAEWLDLARGIAEGEALRVLVPDAKAEQDARRALGALPVTWHRIPFGDIWLRDIAPIFVMNDRGERAGVVFRFNGWGGKYVLPHDDMVGRSIAYVSGLPSFEADLVL